MDKEEFIRTAMQILQDECGASEKEAEAIANLTIQMEKSKIKQLIDDII